VFVEVCVRNLAAKLQLTDNESRMNRNPLRKQQNALLRIERSNARNKAFYFGFRNRA
jgi:hypothetical protein